MCEATLKFKLKSPQAVQILPPQKGMFEDPQVVQVSTPQKKHFLRTHKLSKSWLLKKGMFEDPQVVQISAPQK